MVIPPLRRKVLRDLRRLWAQVLAIALVLAAGVATLILGNGAYSSLTETRDRYYQDSRFADVFADVTRAPRALLADIKAIDGVLDAEARIVKLGRPDLPEMAEPASLLLVSLPSSSGAGLNRLYLRQGRLPDPGSNREILLSEGFATAHGLVPGAPLTMVMNGQRVEMQVTGIALSPEFIYVLGPGDIMPDPRRFGIAWAPRATLQAAFNLDGAFSNVVLKVMPRVPVDRVIEDLGRRTARYGGMGATARKDQISHAFLDAKLNQLSAMVKVLPPIFLLVAAMLVNMTLSRLITLEREQIGLFKAIGYSSRAVSLHYMEFVLCISLIGIVIGLVAGAWLGAGLAGMYARFFSFPLSCRHPGPADLRACSPGRRNFRSRRRHAKRGASGATAACGCNAACSTPVLSEQTWPVPSFAGHASDRRHDCAPAAFRMFLSLASSEKWSKVLDVFYLPRWPVPSNPLTFYEFFAGGGMARAGLGPGWHCSFANDFSPSKASSYMENWGTDHFVLCDVARVEPAQLPGRAALAWASFPCQDLSLAGANAGLGGFGDRMTRSGAFWHFWSVMKALQQEGRKPKTIVLENVCGALTSRGGADFVAICNAFAESGYRFGAVVMDAAHFVPQSRPRVFFMAVDALVPVPVSLMRGSPSSVWHPAALIRAQGTLTGHAKEGWLWWNLPDPPVRNANLADLIEASPTDVRWHSPDETERLLSMMSEVNRLKVKDALRVAGRVVGAVYKRTRPDGNGVKRQRAEVRFDGMAGCLRTPGGGSSRQTIFVVENGCIRSRLLSSREAARLMGLPDSYRMPSRYNEAYHLAGDGVCVGVVRFLAEAVLEPLAGALQDQRLIAAE